MSHKPEILSTETFDTAAKWLKLQRIKYRDQEGKEVSLGSAGVGGAGDGGAGDGGDGEGDIEEERRREEASRGQELTHQRFWEVANRSTRSTAGVDSVHILAILHGEKRKVVLIEQYRPPAGGMVVEFPAGLMDANEDAATTALRELREETGYADGASVRSVSPVLVKDPGMTGANMHLVTVDIRLPPGAPEPEPHLDEGEHIVKRLVAIDELDAVLQDYAKRGFAIDALVQSVATGLSLAA